MKKASRSLLPVQRWKYVRFDPSIRRVEHDAIAIGALCESRCPQRIRLLAYAPFLGSAGSMQMTLSGSRDGKRQVKGKL
jgi:hypothetical protein